VVNAEEEVKIIEETVTSAKEAVITQK